MCRLDSLPKVAPVADVSESAGEGNPRPTITLIARAYPWIDTGMPTCFCGTEFVV